MKPEQISRMGGEWEALVSFNLAPQSVCFFLMLLCFMVKDTLKDDFAGWLFM